MPSPGPDLTAHPPAPPSFQTTKKQMRASVPGPPSDTAQRPIDQQKTHFLTSACLSGKRNLTCPIGYHMLGDWYRAEMMSASFSQGDFLGGCFCRIILGVIQAFSWRPTCSGGGGGAVGTASDQLCLGQSPNLFSSISQHPRRLLEETCSARLELCLILGLGRL